MGLIKPTGIYYAGCFLIIYLSGSVLSSLRGDSLEYDVLLLAESSILLYTFVKVLRSSKMVSREFILFLVFLGIALCINYVNYPKSFSSLLAKALMFVLMICFAKSASLDGIDLGRILYRCILAIALIAIVSFLYVDIIGTVSPVSVVTSGDLSYSEYSPFFYEAGMYSTSVLGLSFTRLAGPFWEPGVFQIYLNFALYRLLFFENKRKRFLVLILVCIALTMSTTGYLLAAILILLYAIRKIDSEKGRFLSLVPVTMAILLIAFQLIGSKAGSANSVSYDLRISDIQVGLNLLAQNPLLGTGYMNEIQFLATQGLNRGSSNGLITWFYSMGVMGLIFAVAPFLINGARLRTSDARIPYVAFVIFFILSNMTEPVYMTPFISLLLAKEYQRCFISFASVAGEKSRTGRVLD